MWAEDFAEEFEECGLAGAIGADNADELAVIDAERHAVDYARGVVGKRYVLQFNHRVIFRKSRALSACAGARGRRVRRRGR